MVSFIQPATLFSLSYPFRRVFRQVRRRSETASEQRDASVYDAIAAPAAGNFQLRSRSVSVYPDTFLPRIEPSKLLFPGDQAHLITGNRVVFQGYSLSG